MTPKVAFYPYFKTVDVLPTPSGSSLCYEDANEVVRSTNSDPGFEMNIATIFVWRSNSSPRMVAQISF